MKKHTILTTSILLILLSLVMPACTGPGDPATRISPR